MKIIYQICKEEDVSIISTHDAIYFELEIPLSSSLPQAENSVETVPLINKKLIWESADIDSYQENLETFLENNFQFWNQPQCIQTLALLIPQSFIQAADISVPSKQMQEITFKTVKCEKWLKAEIAAKKASKKWVKMGKPRNVENQLFIAKKETNLLLRKAINCNLAESSMKENNTMMEANFRDPKLFSKIVNRKRINKQGYTTLINVDGKEYRGDAQVLAGFFNYHNGNSSPPPLTKSEDNSNYFYSTINVQAISYIIKQRKWRLPQLTFNQVQNLIERLKTNK